MAAAADLPLTFQYSVGAQGGWDLHLCLIGFSHPLPSSLLLHHLGIVPSLIVDTPSFVFVGPLVGHRGNCQFVVVFPQYQYLILLVGFLIDLQFLL